MFFTIGLRNLLMVLSFSCLIMMGGCLGPSSLGDKDAIGPLEELFLGEGSAINLANSGSVNLQGTCSFEGEASLRFFQGTATEGATPEETDNSVSVSIICNDGEWEALGLTQLSGFDEGEISVEILKDGARLGKVLTLTKDIQVPVLEDASLAQIADVLNWSWVCAQDSDCFEYRMAINADPNYDFPAADYARIDGQGFFAQLQRGIPNDFTSNGDEDLYVHVQARDKVGNLSTNILRSEVPLRIDNVFPMFSSASASSDNESTNFAQVGNEVTLTVLFDDEVSVESSAQLQLVIGGATTAADFMGTPATLDVSHQFRYTVEEGHNGAITVRGVVSGSGRVQDHSQNDLTVIRSLAVSGVTVDTAAPTVSIRLNSGGNGWEWSCADASTCLYRYDVTVDSSKESLATELVAGESASPPSGGTPYYVHVEAIDAAGNSSGVVSGETPLAGSLTDTTPPVVTAGLAAPGAYKEGDDIVITLSFDEQVQAVGAPVLNLTVGGTASMASLTSTAGELTRSLRFTYSVVAGHNGTFELTHFSAFDATNNIENASSGRLVADFSDIAIDSGVGVDTTVPHILSATATSNNASGQYAKAGDDVTVTVVFNEAVKITGGADLQLSIGGTAVTASLSATSNYQISHQVIYQIQSNQDGAIQITGVDVSGGGSVGDPAQNPLGAATASVSGVTVDTVAPVVTITKEAGQWTWACVDNVDACSYRFEVTSSDVASFAGAYGNTGEEALPTAIGTHYLHVEAKDRAGNTASHSSQHDVVLAPRVSSVQAASDASLDSNFAKAGDTLTLTVTFNKALTVTGTGANTPKLAFKIGTSAALEASFAGTLGTPSATQSFTYTVLDNQNGAITVTGVDANGGGVEDEDGTTPESIAGAGILAPGVTVDAVAPGLIILKDADKWTWSCSNSEDTCSYRFEVSSSSTPNFAGAYGSTSEEALPTDAENHYLHVEARDRAGNIASNSNQHAVIVAPRVSSVQAVSSSSLDTNFAKAGDMLTLTVTFNETVTVTGTGSSTPELAFKIGTSAALEASFAGTTGSSSAAHSFTYTVLDNQNGEITVTGIDANGGSIVDGNGTAPASIAAAGVPAPGVTVDTTAPTFSVGLNADSDGWDWSCDGADTCKYRHLLSNNATETSVSGDWDSIVIAFPREGETDYVHVQARDQVGNVSGIVSSSSSLTGVSNPRIISITGPAGHYKVGDQLDLTLTFNEEVRVKSTNAYLQTAILTSTSGTSVHRYVGSTTAFSTTKIFRATVSSNVVSSQLRVWHAGSLTTNVVDSDNNGLTAPTLPIVLEGVFLDNVAPTVESVTLAPGQHNLGANLNFIVRFSEDVIVTGSPTLTFSIGTGIAKLATFNGVEAEAHREHQFTYTIAAGDSGNGVSVTSFSSSYDIKDRAGHLSQDLGGHTIASTVDAKRPLLSSANAVSSSAIDSSFAKAGDVLTITANFDEAVTVTGAPKLLLGIGTSTALEADFAGLLNTSVSSHTFTYTVLDSQDGAVTIAGIDVSGGSVVDAVGNPATVSSSGTTLNGVTLDTTLPSVSISVNAGNDGWTWSCNDASTCRYRYLLSNSASETTVSGAWATGTSAFPRPLQTDYLHLQAIDQAGNESAITSSTSAVTNNNPAVLSVSALAGRYKHSATITFSVTFSKSVTVAGTPSLNFDIVGSSETFSVEFDTATSTTGTSLSFSGTAPNFDLTASLRFTGISFDSSESIKDSDSNDLLTPGSFDLADVIIDNQAPTVNSIAAASNSSFDPAFARENDVVTFTVTFSEKVQAKSASSIRPKLTLSIGSTTGLEATFVGGANIFVNNQTFTYTVLANQNGNISVSAVDFNGTQIEDGAGNDLLAITVTAIDGLSVDTMVPTVTNLVAVVDRWTWGCNSGEVNNCKYRFVINSAQATPSFTGVYVTTTEAVFPNIGGVYYLHVEVTDDAGNSSTLTSPVLNSSLPAPTIANAGTLPALEESIAATYTLSGTCEEGIDIVTIHLVGGNVTTPCSEGQWTHSDFNWTGRPLSGNSVEVSVSQVNALNQQGTSSTASISITMPTVGLSDASLPVLTPANEASYTLSGTCESSIGTVTINLPEGRATAPCSEGQWTHSDLNLGDQPVEGNVILVSASQTNFHLEETSQEVSISVGNFPETTYHVSRVNSGNYVGCFITPDLELNCWGENGKGQLGSGDNTFRFYPVPVLDVGGAAGSTLGDVVQVVTAQASTCALNLNGEVMCWGGDPRGKFANGGNATGISEINYPKRIGEFTNVIQVANASTAGNTITCVLLENQTLQCWGYGSFGGMGRGNNTRSNYVPRPVFGPGGAGTLLRNNVQIALAYNNVCALNSFGNVYCWGDSNFVGAYTATSTLAERVSLTLPSLLPDIGGATGSSLSDVVSLVSDTSGRFCALIDDGDDTNGNIDGTVACWGWIIEQSAGALYWWSPYQIPGLSNVVRVSVGEHMVCGLKGDNTVQCWGNSTGMGDGVFRSSSADNAVVTVKNSDNSGTLQGVLDISSTLAASCAHLDTNQVQCWGRAKTPKSMLLAPSTYTNPDDSDIKANLTPLPALASSGGSPIELGMVYAHPVRICRDGHERCYWNKVWPDIPNTQENPTGGAGAVSVDVYGLKENQTAEVYLGSDCTTSLGTASGVSDGSVQSLSINPLVGHDAIVHFKVTGTVVNRHTCLPSSIRFDWEVPSLPSSATFAGTYTSQTYGTVTVHSHVLTLDLVGASGADTIDIHFNDPGCLLEATDTSAYGNGADASFSVEEGATTDAVTIMQEARWKHVAQKIGVGIGRQGQASNRLTREASKEKAAFR